MRFQKNIFLVRWLLVCCLLAGCAEQAQKTSLSDAEIKAAHEDLKIVQAQVEKDIVEPVSSERAKQLAARFLALRQITWGKPTSLTEDPQQYFVAYETPANELRLIGARVLLVDKASGLVTPQQRR